MCRMCCRGSGVRGDGSSDSRERDEGYCNQYCDAKSHGCTCFLKRPRAIASCRDSGSRAGTLGERSPELPADPGERKEAKPHA